MTIEDTPENRAAHEEINDPKYPPASSDAIRMRLLMLTLGTISGLHPNLDRVRDDQTATNPRLPVDHNIEQAQILLETAFLRIQQAMAVVSDRMAEQARNDAVDQANSEAETDG